MSNQFVIKQEPNYEIYSDTAFPELFAFSSLPLNDGTCYMGSSNSSEYSTDSPYSTESADSTAPPYSPEWPDSTESESELKSKRKSKSTSENVIPPLWVLEKLDVDEKFKDGVPPTTPLTPEERLEEIKKFLPKKRNLSPEVQQRADELMKADLDFMETFVAMQLHKYPIDNSYHANKARKYSPDPNAESSDEMSQRQMNRKANNGKSMESRTKKKQERTESAYKIIYLRELILEYQLRMDYMKALMDPTALDAPVDDSRNGKRDSESLSSWTVFE